MNDFVDSGTTKYVQEQIKAEVGNMNSATGKSSNK